MPANGDKKPRNRSRKRLTFSVLLLVVIAGSLVAALSLLPPRAVPDAPPPGGGRTAGSSTSPESHSVPEEDTPQRTPPTGGPAAARDGGGPAGSPERPVREAAIAVVVDDVGYSLDALREFLDFPGPVTFAVLPQLPYTVEAARLIRAAGKELILHLPMEALNGDEPGPGAILSTYSNGEIRRRLEEDFAGLEAAAGVNNHMGSLATADKRVMEAVMGYLRGSGRYFLDSRTTAQSQAPDAAEAAGVPFIERDVFIDNQIDGESMRAAFQKGLAVARARGQAVLIGHVYNPELLVVLREILEEAEPYGVRLVPLSELVGAGARAR